MQTPARFITVEGGEGVGKSTNLALIEACLRERGIDVLVTREPGGTQLGEQLRELLLGVEGTGPVPMAELLMIFAARAQHLDLVIKPALARGSWVLCDRFTDATYAYQGYGRDMDLSAIKSLEDLVQDSFCPDLTVLLDLSPEVGLARAAQRGELDRFEQENNLFFNRVREGYLTRAKTRPEHWLVVDAGKPLEDVQSALIHQLTDWLDRLDG